MRNPYYKPLPPEMNSPTTAWPYMRRRFPWLFNEEGEMPPKEAQLEPTEQDVIKFAVYMLQDKHYTLADIAEALTGRREYGGSIFTRVKAVKRYLENTTTTDQDGLGDEILPEMAA